MLTLAEIKARIEEKEANITAFMDAGKTDEAREASGALAELRIMYQAEAERIEQENQEISARINAIDAGTPDAPVSFADQVLGGAENFGGIDIGFKGSGSLQNTVTSGSGGAAGATELPMPTTMDTNLPGVVEKPEGFLDTLPKYTTDGAEQYFLPPTFTNNADIHSLGETKEKSKLEWTSHTSSPATVAHWIPVHKQMAKRYSALRTVINVTLVRGLHSKKDYEVIYGDDQNGILGVVNFPGIGVWEYDDSDDMNIVDNLADMAAKAELESGLIPNYCALSTNAIRAIAKTKDKNGNYLFRDFKAGDTIPGTNMVAVPDVNMSVLQSDGTRKEGAIVYNNGACALKTLDGDTVEVGVINAQFVENAYTVLAEGTCLLRVDNPHAFVYCDDLNIGAKASGGDEDDKASGGGEDDKPSGGDA